MTGGHGGSSGGHSSGGHSSSAGHSSSGHAAGSCHTGTSTHTTAAAPAHTTVASTGSGGSSSSSSLSSGHNMTSGSGSDPVQTDANQGQQSGGMMQGIKDTMAGIFGGSKSSTDASQQQGQAGTASQSSHQMSGSTTTTTASNPPGSAAGMTHTTGTDAANAQPKDIYLQGIKTFDPAEPNVARAAQQKGTEAVNNASNSSMSSNSSSSMSSSSMSSSSMSSHPTSSTTTTHTTGSMMGAHHNDSGVTGMAAGSGASTISSQGFKHDTMNFDGKDLNATNRPTGIRPVGASDSTTMAAPSQ